MRTAGSRRAEEARSAVDDPELRLGAMVLSAAGLDRGDEREALLRRASGGDPELLAEARRRLAAEPPSTFLAAPAELTLDTFGEGESAEVEPPPGDERYRIGELLGRGGMARVYRAHDLQLDRPVALKLLDRPHGARAERFLREARAQARIRHDNVLEIYETGELGGRPYIAMRCVEGPTLLELGHEAGLETRVRLLAQVAEGLHAAHRAGLLHRDVKPSNVLVEVSPDGELKPYVADFGIAAELGEGAAALDSWSGTVAYMAPERLRGGQRVDRRSDVYSLGVTLYRLLTGELPPTAELPGELPSTLPRDLAAIVGKCLAEAPEDRYSSARALAEDLRRFLDGEVVEARAAGLAYRLSRRLLRHRRLFAAAAVAGLLLTVALVVAAVMGVVAMRANARAEARQAQAEDLIGFMLTDLRQKLEPASRLEVLDDVGQKALEYFAAVPEAELSEEELLRRSTALYQIGQVRLRRGDLEGAREPLEESLALASELAARDPADAQRRYGLAQSHFWLGSIAWRRGDLDAALERFTAYRDLARELAASDPSSPEWRMEVAYGEGNVGRVLEARGQLAPALAAYAHRTELIEGLTAEHPERQDWRLELASSHLMTAAALEAAGDLENAVEHYQADLEIVESLAAAEPEHRGWQERLATSHSYVGTARELRSELELALEHFRKQVEGTRRLVALDPENTSWRFSLAVAHANVGRVLGMRGDTHGELEEVRAALEGLGALVEREPAVVVWRRQLATRRLQMAAAYARLGEPEAALASVDRAATQLEDLVAQHDDDDASRLQLARARMLRGDLLAELGEGHLAAECHAQAHDILEGLAEDSRDALVLAPFARSLRALGRGAEAEEILDGLRRRGYDEEVLARL